MTERKDFKKLVRDRMRETGETYTAARAALEPSPVGLAPGWTLSELMNAATEEARRLCTTYVGIEHCIVAMVRAAGGQVAHDVLTQAGMTIELAEASVKERQEQPATTITYNPAYLIANARAEGVASAHGLAGLAEHFVGSMLWDKHNWLRWEDAVPRAAVVAGLTRHRVVLPRTPMPELDRWTATQRVELTAEQLDAVLDELNRMRQETGARFGFNWHADGTAFVVADDSLDLAAAVRRTTSQSPA